MEHLGQNGLPLVRRVQRMDLHRQLVLLRRSVVAQRRQVHVHQAARHLPRVAQVLEDVRAVAHDRPPVPLVAELHALVVPARARRAEHRRERGWRERGREAAGRVAAVRCGVHEAQRTEAREVEQHDARADAVRVVPLGLALLGVRRHRDRGRRAEAREVVPEQRGVRDEEGIGVDEDGARDGVGEDLVDEELHEAGCGG